MVRIRLRREGKKGHPSYRIVAAEKESPRDGRFLEILGHYNPRTNPSTISIKEDRVFDWIKRGAQPSDSVWQIFRQSGTDQRIERFKAGEDVATLLAEAKTGKTAIDPSTEAAEAPAKPSRKSKAAAEADALKPKPEMKTEPESEPDDTAGDEEEEA